MLPALLFLLACGADDTAPSTPSTTGSDTGADATTTPPDTSPPTPTGTETGTETATDTGTASAPLEVLARGPWPTTIDEGSTATSCTMAWTRHAPDGVTDAPLVLLAHGFARARRHHADLADHLASWGFEVVRPDLCHASLTDTDHPQNGVDLVDLAEALADGREVWFVGHSAGGLASALAAAASPRTAGHLGLDMVDANGLGLDALATLPVPTAALLGMAEPCNSQGNAVAAYEAAPEAAVLRLPGADHCDFESPTDALCTAFCANGSGPEPATAEGIRGLATAWLLWQSGLAPEAATWWEGEALDTLVDSGMVTVLR